MMGRIVRAADFERVLKSGSQSRSPHFAVHHLSANPSRPTKALAASFAVKLSTAAETAGATAVDDRPPKSVWLGVVVPKRHARRSVTRTLLKRHIRAAMLRQQSPATGLWVVRLRAPFDPLGFPSAASLALAEAAAAELDRVLGSAALRLRGS